MRVADSQQPGDGGTGHKRPAYSYFSARDGDSVQRREALDSKEIQAAQIKDEAAGAHDVGTRVLGQGAGVRSVDLADSGDNGYQRRQPATGPTRGVSGTDI